MPVSTCLTCGAIIPKGKSRCRIHRTPNARGYGTEHKNLRKQHLQARPMCSHCGHTVKSTNARCNDVYCKRCPLEFHHVSELRGGRSTETDDRRQLLCRVCHLKIKEKQ